jgi:hypothetical protein
MAALSLDKIEAIAPDQASLSAARKLLKPGLWSGLAADGGGLLWGECQGSGATPYRVAVSEPDTGYKCTCPSRKFPCKHSLGLMWLRAEGKTAFETSAAPEWVQDWVRRRRPFWVLSTCYSCLEYSSIFNNLHCSSQLSSTLI